MVLTAECGLLILDEDAARRRILELEVRRGHGQETGDEGSGGDTHFQRIVNS